MSMEFWVLSGFFFALVVLCIYLVRENLKLQEKIGWLEMSWDVERMTFQAYRKVYGPPDQVKTEEPVEPSV